MKPFLLATIFSVALPFSAANGGGICQEYAGDHRHALDTVIVRWRGAALNVPSSPLQCRRNECSSIQFRCSKLRLC